MNVEAFDFDLPESRIALRPAVPRDSARLLHVPAHGDVEDLSVLDIVSLLRAGDVLVINDTRVLRAALVAVRPARAHGGGGDVDVTVNLHKYEAPSTWRAFVRPAKRLKVGDTLHFSHGLTARVTDKQDGGDVALTFSVAGDALRDAIEKSGQPPLPPYIARKRAPDEKDICDYQTIYAQDAGSVAAPTAGLHFTERLFEDLKAACIQIERVTLHVGAGTFLPVKCDDTSDHAMHSEWYELQDDVARRINAAKSEGRRIIAVGTTALRVLESAANDLGHLVSGSADTDIFITPGYEFKIIDGLMTNFHLPKSTLFMLVSALAGLDRMQSAYRHAIDSDYRFYSYGDSSLIWKAA